MSSKMHPSIHHPMSTKVTPGTKCCWTCQRPVRCRPFVTARPRFSPCSAAQQQNNTSISAAAAAAAPWSKAGYLDAAVSKLPESQQALIIAGIAAALGVGTAVSASVIGPAISPLLPSFLQVTGESWFPLGPIFMAAGVAHFTEEQGFINMYPHQGAWGIWNLPGSAKFHVQWTGVAEILGGLGMMLGALPFDFIPSWLSPASAYGLFLLTICVTPANIYMYTHNAPGPVPESVAPGPIPPGGHAARGLMQVLLLSTLWGIATASS